VTSIESCYDILFLLFLTPEKELMDGIFKHIFASLIEVKSLISRCEKGVIIFKFLDKIIKSQKSYE